MRLGWLVGTCALTGLLGAGWATPAGKVVRVERTTRAHTPIVCMLNSQAHGYCLERPAIGDRVEVLGEDKILTELAITAVEQDGQCLTPWGFTADGARGSADQPPSGIGLIDVPMDRTHAHVIRAQKPPPGVPGEAVLVALDRDGDGSADFEVVMSSCDDGSVAPVPSAQPACIDTWADDNNTGRWQRTSRMTMPACSQD